MAKKEDVWRFGEDPPEIGLHSLAKHRVYEEYITHYIQVLNTNPLIPNFSLILVDGFAGGGVYINPEDKNRYSGSPLRLIRAAEDAEALVNTTRQLADIHTPFKLWVEYFFIEKNRTNLKYLRNYLKENGLADRFDKQIHLIGGKFTERLDRIIKRIQDSGANRRCIFLLDQYGYSDVPFNDIQKIFSKLPNAEIILTFATDWLIDYMSKEPAYFKALHDIGLADYIDIDSLLEEKLDNPEWRLMAQLQLHNGIYIGSGAKHYTPFFIESQKSKKTYWLVHLSNHPRARDVMTELHWSLKNHFTHHGGAGLNMFGYRVGNDQKLTGLKDMFENTQYSFDETAKSRTFESLLTDLPRHIHPFSNGLKFSDLYRGVANNTPATSKHIKESIVHLLHSSELVILNSDGRRRRKTNSIDESDVILLPQQTVFVFDPQPKVKNSEILGLDGNPINRAPQVTTPNNLQRLKQTSIDFGSTAKQPSIQKKK